MKANDPVLEKMGTYVEKWKSINDSRFVFLSCYHLMSSNMIRAIESGEFNDPEWVEELLHLFADYYFEGLSCYECGSSTPKVWEHAHKASLDNDLSELQNLILGVNAHINYDLVLALYDMLKPSWNTLSDIERKERFEDHCHVNHVIAQTIDRVQDDILEPLNPTLDWIDRLFGRVDEYLISRLISSWRTEVWNNTQLLLNIQSSQEREAFRLNLEKKVLQRADTISLF